MDVSSLPKGLRYPIVFGPWLVAAVGLVTLVYVMLVHRDDAISTTCIVFGGLLVVTAVIVPRAESFSLGARGLTTDLGNSFVGPATAPRRPMKSDRTPVSAARSGASADDAASPVAVAQDARATPSTALSGATIGDVVTEASHQGWRVETVGPHVNLVNPDGQMFSFSERAKAEPISEGFLGALQGYGLDWPS